MKKLSLKAVLIPTVALLIICLVATTLLAVTNSITAEKIALNAVETENFIICGTRGWLFENGEPHDAKILQREAGRLELSLQSIKSEKEKVVFLHYPPVYGDQCSTEILDMLLKYNVKRCYYGHIHGYGIGNALNGIYAGIDFKLISADALGFCPIEIV